MLFVIACLLLYHRLTLAFNIDLNKNSIYVMVKGASSFAEKSQENNETAFFGFHLYLDKTVTESGSQIGLAVSAPLQVVSDYKSNEEQDGMISKEPIPKKRSAYIPTDAKGVVYLCEVPLASFTNRSENRVHNCTNRLFIDRSLTAGELSDDDSLGMSLIGRKFASNQRKLTEQNQFVSCAPLRLRDCGSFLKTEGACYVSVNVPSRGDSLTATTWTKKSPCKESCIRRDIDLMYVIDGSFSVGKNNFMRVKNWIKNVTEGFDIADQVHVGVVQYSYHNISNPSDNRYLTTEITLGQYKNFENFSESVDNIKYQGYQTFTAHAIMKTVTEDFNGPSRRYPDARRVMILLTDGKADDRSYLPNATQYAVENGVESFAIGIGNFDRSELEIIAGDDERVLTVEGFEELGEIVSRLQNDIQVLEGANSPDQHNELSHCEVGISAKFIQSGGLYLGAVGAWDWSGTIVKYDTADDQLPDIPSFEEVQKVLVNRTKESYLGYALTSGYYNGMSQEYVAIGAPRYQLEGAVVIYKPENNNAAFTNAQTIYPNSKITQLGSYFGGALLSMDLNSDGKDDLLVGAPLYIGTSYDMGRVYVYISSPNDNPEAWASTSYEPIILFGKFAGGRFGSALAFAGDLNKDGFNDVVVGAPYTEGNKGAVYIFHGSQAGIDNNPRQEILASSLSNSNLKYFGLSIQGGQDLDGNGYPDLAVGAPKSDAVVIFRSRPVVNFAASIDFSVAQINVFECFNKKDRNCLSLTAHLTARGENIGQFIRVSYTITLDSDISTRESKRVKFQGGQTSEESYFLEDMKTLERNIESSWSYNITVKNAISDYSTPIKVNFTYDLASAHTAQPLSSVRDPNAKNSVTTSVSFARGCGNDDTCRYNLVLVGDVHVPQATLESDGKDLTDGGKRLIISQQTQNSPLSIKVNLTNTGDNAFDVRVSVTFNNQLSWNNLGNIKSSTTDPNTDCVRVNPSQDTNDKGYRSKSLIYEQSSLLGSIMQSNQWCSFEFNLTTSGLGSSSTLSNINVTVFAFTTRGITNDTNPTDNVYHATNPVRYRADAIVSTRSPETVIPFNFTNENVSIFSVLSIGKGTPDISISYQVDSQGFANIPFSTISFTFPFTMPGKNMQHLLYLYKYSCESSQGKAACICDESEVNPYQLLKNFPPSNTTGLRNVTVIANSKSINKSIIYDCSNGGNESLVECRTFTCNITNLEANDVIEFQADFRLWSQSLNLQGSNNVTFVSDFVYDTTMSSLLINKEGGNITKISRTINTVARLFTEPVVVEQGNNIWIIIAAAIGGLLLLILIIIILWKLGFFKSKYAQKKEELEWSEPNQDID